MLSSALLADLVIVDVDLSWSERLNFAADGASLRNLHACDQAQTVLTSHQVTVTARAAHFGLTRTLTRVGAIHVELDHRVELLRLL